jgi:Zn-dependent M16 (insulinase) family peptidase
MQSGWFFGGDPYQGLEYEKTLKTLKTALTSDYLEKLITKYFLNNPHSLMLTLEPKPGMDKERNDRVAAELKKYKESLTAAQLENLVSETNALIEYQKREDTPEALAKVPLLELKDVDPKAAYYTLEELKSAGIPLLYHNTFTNNIAYITLLFDMRVLPADLIPYASLLTNLLGSLNTEKYSYGELTKQININTGGINTSLRTYLESFSDDKLVPLFACTGKVMNGNTEKLFEIGNQILLKSAFSDTERLKTLINRLQSQLDANAKRDGMSIAQNRLASYVTNMGMLNELTGGLGYYWFVTDLSKNFDAKSAEIISNLSKTASLLFNSANMTVALTGAKPELENFNKYFGPFVKNFPSVKSALMDWQLKPEAKNEGILTSSKVQYVVEGYDFKKLGYSWDGKMRVLNQIVSTDWLKNRVRVIGGAYGGYATIQPSGMFTFNSYRDPNLRETLDNYSGTVDYLNTLELSDVELSRYIIGTISSMDRPLTPSQKGDQALSYYFMKRSAAAVQKDRDDILSTKPADIKSYQKMISDILAKKTWCVYGNADKLKASPDLFKELIQISK